jgi:predicted NodU family carbamoyl transferase
LTAILRISAFYHDSAAALVVDGDIVAAAQEERFSRRKHDADFPAQAIAYCLEDAGLTPFTSVSASAWSPERQNRDSRKMMQNSELTLQKRI